MERSRCQFLVWAPFQDEISVHLVEPRDEVVAMTPLDNGYFTVEIDGVEAGARYFYRFADGEDRPDPASSFQPEGVDGPSEVIDPDGYTWADGDWRGVPRKRLVFYELHVGTYTQAGTYEALLEHLDEIADLGVTAIELMPLAQCSGERNWGYDGVFPFAPQHAYGRPEDVKRLVDACHARGMAVIHDVVFNHIGPEGNYLPYYGPYHSQRYSTPWGPALNYDGPDSDEVRRYFIESAMRWISDYHFDGFRLDAIQLISDKSAQPFMQVLTDEIHELGTDLGRHVHVTAESLMNDPRVINPRLLGGFGMDAEWNDDFHHALIAYLTGEKTGYYADFGSFSDVTTAYRSGFVYTGRKLSFRGALHGDIPRLYTGDRLIVFSQNHDRVGNRAQGDRLSTMMPFELQKVVAATVLLSPYLPMLFMGEEYGETSPFQFFVDFSDPTLIEAVRAGRKSEFAMFEWQGEISDPQDPATFERSKLHHELARKSPHRELRAFYRELLRLRREHPVFDVLSMRDQDVVQYQAQRVLMVRRWSQTSQLCIVHAFGRGRQTVTLPLPEGRWRKVLDSASECWAGAGMLSPDEMHSDGEIALALEAMSCVVYEPVNERT